MKKNPILIVTIISAWLGLGFFTYTLLQEGNNLFTTLFNEICYFTVQSNLLVAILSTLLLINNERSDRVFRVLEFVSLVTITVTAGVYFALFRDNDAMGIARLADITQHYVTPALYLLYWFQFRRKTKISFNYILILFGYVLSYLTFTLVRGSIDGYYPYFFLNPVENGWNTVLVYSVSITLFILALSFLFLSLNNKLATKT